MAQYNPRRATQRRKPEIMTSVANQPFDDDRFNFSKINDTKEFLFGLQFEEDTVEVKVSVIFCQRQFHLLKRNNSLITDPKT